MKLVRVLFVMVAIFALTSTSQAWFLDFEWGLGHNYEEVQSGIPGLNFSTELFYADATTDIWGFSSYDLGLEWSTGQYWMEGNVAISAFAGDIGRIDFVNADASYFTTGYCTFMTFTLEAYDINDNLLSYVSGPGNTRYVDGNPFGMGYLTVATGMSDIAYVILQSESLWFDVDNMSGDASGVSIPSAVPEPATMVLFGMGLLGMSARLRKRMKK